MIKEQTKPKPRRGRKPRPPSDRGTALAVADMFGGNLTRAARMTGIPVRTLFSWQHELDPDNQEVTQAREEGRRTILDVLTRYIEALAAIAIMKAHTASFKDLYYAMGIMLDKLEKLSRIDREQQTQAPQMNLHATFEQEREHWEGLVEIVMFEAKKDGYSITREEAIEAIIKGSPHAKKFLK